jgi:hypothetical protein
MPENNPELSYGTPEVQQQNSSYDVEEPTDSELERFAQDASKIFEEAESLNLNHEAKRVKAMEKFLENIENPEDLLKKQEDIQHLKGIFAGSAT